jgi:hypothetical protein
VRSPSSAKLVGDFVRTAVFSLEIHAERCRLMSLMPGVFNFLGTTELLLIVLFVVALAVLIPRVGRGKRLR